jgi:hypothetical protein
MFYFLTHIYLIHALTVAFALVRHGRADFAFGSPPALPAYPTDYGYSLPTVYAVWIVVVAMLYPLCRWFGNVKKRRTDWWLGYL